MAVKKVKRNIFQRLLGKQATPLPVSNDFWSYKDGLVKIDLAGAGPLNNRSGAVRLEGKGLPKNLLVVHGEDDQYHVFHNACAHGGRGLDPVPGEKMVQCCSMGTSTYDYEGTLIEGSAQSGIETYPIVRENGNLIIKL